MCHHSMWPRPLPGRPRFSVLGFISSVCRMQSVEGFCFLCGVEGGTQRYYIPYAAHALCHVHPFCMPWDCVGRGDGHAQLLVAEVAVKLNGGVTYPSFTMWGAGCRAKVHIGMCTPSAASSLCGAWRWVCRAICRWRLRWSWMEVLPSLDLLCGAWGRELRCRLYSALSTPLHS